MLKEISDELTVKQLTRVLFDQARRLTENYYDCSCELVQEVWYKVLAHENLDKEKLNAAYLTQVLKNHFFDRKRSINSKETELPEKLEVQDETQSEEFLIKKLDPNGTDQYVKEIWHYLEHHKDGWIFLEMVNRECSLKMLAQYKGITHKALQKKKERLLIEMKKQFKGGKDFEALWQLISKRDLSQK